MQKTISAQSATKKSELIVTAVGELLEAEPTHR